MGTFNMPEWYSALTVNAQNLLGEESLTGTPKADDVEVAVHGKTLQKVQQGLLGVQDRLPVHTSCRSK